MKRYQQIGEALGSKVQITLVDDGPKPSIDKLFDEIWDKINAFERKFSRFLGGSELTKVNRSAGTKIKPSKEFLELLRACKDQSKKTKGLFNPFILPGLQSSGYLNSWPEVQNQTTLDYRERKIVDISSLEIGVDWAKIPSLSALEFGGIGKGYLLDKLADMLGRSIFGYWISIGGDIICSGQDLGNQDWEIMVQNASNINASVGSIKSKKGGRMGIATSGVTKRKGSVAGQSWHHIIDPRTNLPAKTDVLTATVSARNATEADIIAKCLVILGSKESQKFFEASEGESAIIQLSTNNEVIEYGAKP